MSSRTILVTGGCGFIGSNAAYRFQKAGWKVVVVDNLSRRGTDKNLEWLKQELNGSFVFEQIDIRNFQLISEVIKKHKPQVVLHLAAQVAVTTSVIDPRTDLEINILGTFNLLESIRLHAPDSIFINASTNKVYGHLDHLKLDERETRYESRAQKGVSEQSPLEFYSPYGCSKGAADQYTVDYSRIYSLRSVTLRQSCIYGYRQFGIEDQGWVAWFMIAHSLNRPITIYGNGKQVRDVLFVDDLIDCYEAVINNIDKAKGNAYNIGGGYQNSMSLIEFLEKLQGISGKKISTLKGNWRPGDQPYYVSDISKASLDLNWQPKINIETGLRELYQWVDKNRSSLEKII